MPRTAIVAGATGLVGNSCLRRLASEPAYSQVVALVRRASRVSGEVVRERVVDYESLNLSDIAGGADVFCALGTTIRTAGSQEAFRKVDYGHVVTLAKHCLEHGARQFAVVSSVGANAASSNFYVRTKGEMEAEVSSMGFPAVLIFRPGVLVGQRSEPRPIERAAITIMRTLEFALIGGLRKYRAIATDTVAAGMVAAARKGDTGVHVYHFDEIRQLAGAS